MIPSSAELAQRFVLIVQPSAESRDVLRTVLERRGIGILEAEEPQAGLDLLQRYHPDVTVLDVETVDDEATRTAFQSQTGPSLVILGNVRKGSGWPPADRVHRKPYHFAPLVRTIELLLQKDVATTADLPS